MSIFTTGEQRAARVSMDKQAQRSAYTQENIGLQEREFWHKLQPE